MILLNTSRVGKGVIYVFILCKLLLTPPICDVLNLGLNLNFQALKFSGLQDTQLSQLHKQHQEYNVAFDVIKKMQDAGARILQVIKLSLSHSMNCESIAVWKK